ncbi:MAG TPA: hypothetical protein VH253_00630 [Phycisphaerae bacterium]|nr:hypothetical protein [Phycisphaerae bacterium]
MPTLEYARPSRARRPFGRRFSLLALPLLWLCALVGTLFVVPLAAALVAIALLVYHRRLPALLLTLVFSPFCVFFINGVGDYAIGTAHLREHGPPHRLGPVDPTTRLQPLYTGDVSLGNEWITYSPYNLGAGFMSRLLGPMPGSYTGPYPDRAAAFAAIRSGSRVDLHDVADDRVHLHMLMIQLPPGMGSALLYGFHEGPATDIENPKLLASYGPARGVVYRSTLLILAVPTRLRKLAGDPDTLLLLDLDHDRLINVYDALGSHYSPVVPWY